YAKDRISISSYSIGPRVDNQVLGSLAQNTGGMLLVDREDWSGAQIGGRLADMARTTVIWPSAAELPAGYVQTYFRDMPPLRFDRDTVLLGKLAPTATEGVGAAGIEVRGEMDGKAVRLH